MIKVLKSKKFLKKILLLAVIIYITYLFISQQRILDSYRLAERHYTEQAEAKSIHRDSLATTRANIDSIEYIEQMAREKLDMFLPNERVYVNVTR
ncbi:MAG: septum formation initiator family protein [Oscillospiraceae bacterium]|nr:septum formation initiator family protein [Oscillospiraceae bacterium]